MQFNNALEQFKDALKIPLILYVDVYPFTITNKGEVFFLLLKRREDVLLPGDWQVLCGKIKPEEKISAAFARQVKNKTGKDPIALYKLDFINTFYDEYYDSVLMVPCAAARLDSMDIEIDASLHVEHKWATYTEACELLAWENQRHCLSLVQSLLKENSLILKNKSLALG